jgi:hypothetical protein
LLVPAVLFKSNISGDTLVKAMLKLLEQLVQHCTLQ